MGSVELFSRVQRVAVFHSVHILQLRSDVRGGEDGRSAAVYRRVDQQHHGREGRGWRVLRVKLHVVRQVTSQRVVAVDDSGGTLLYFRSWIFHPRGMQWLRGDDYEDNYSTSN